MLEGHKIKKKLEPEKFLEEIKKLKPEQIIITEHTFFRLAEKQRKVYKDRIIKEFLFEKVPILVGIQHNDNYSVYYSYNELEALKIILGMYPDKVYVVTFYITNKNQIPKI